MVLVYKLPHTRSFYFSFSINIYNPRQNIWDKVKKYNKIGQHSKIVISNFACVFNRYRTKFFMLDIKYLFSCGNSCGFSCLVFYEIPISNHI